MIHPKISIITPSFNQGGFLEETIVSVISQGYPNLEYIIMDGGSTDASIEIIKKYGKHLSYWMSEKDNGLYHALQKGFEKSSGEIMGWINSDDLLHRKSLFVLANIFENNPRVNWLQGHPTVYDESGMTVDNNIPPYSKYHFYLKKYIHGDFIQQESTYWRRSLWDRAGGYISRKFKYAGDFDLWMRFFNYEQLFCTKALVGGYRVKKDQLSRSFYNEYLAECSSIIDELELTGNEKRCIKKIQFIETKLLRFRLLRPAVKNYYQKLYGYQPPVKFNFQTGKFEQ